MVDGTNMYRVTKEGTDGWMYADIFPDELKTGKLREYKHGDVVPREEYRGDGNPAEAAARQVGGVHYKGKKCEVWTIVDEYGLDYYLGNALKYILRNKMNHVEDIKKAHHYLEKWIESNA